MKTSFFFILYFMPFLVLGQGVEQENKVGSFYLYWGWNGSQYSTSNLHFSGEHYDFILSDVQAKDRQTPFDFSTYFSPTTFTIPQYNYRLGYYLKNNYDISIGMDHMKYVMVAHQKVSISGEIAQSNTPYDGNYSSDEISLSPDFLQFEHTDGLNYVNVELRKTKLLTQYKSFKMSEMHGLGLGLIVPKTNTTLLGHERFDEFHLSGYGASIVTGLRFDYKKVFIQAELKGGWINMPHIRTTSNTIDVAKQSFFFSQFNVVFGVFFLDLK